MAKYKNRQMGQSFHALILVMSTLLCSISVNAQLNADTNKQSITVDLALASSGSSNAYAIGLDRMHALGKSRRMRIGYGLRGTGFYGRDNGFVTAPASVSEGNFFKVQNEDKLDTLYLPHASVFSVNAVIHLGYRFTDRLSAEFNIDAIGWTFGADRSGRFEAESQSASSPAETAYVSPFNLLLTGDFDLGSLNSEISLNARLTDLWMLRVGATFLFTEFTTYNQLTFDNDRFRRKSLMPMIAVGYRL